MMVRDANLESVTNKDLPEWVIFARDLDKMRE